MGVTKKMIVIEDRLQEMFDNLPPFIGEKNVEFKPLFKYGDEKELIAFLKENQEQQSPYPLIWLVYPYEESHTRTNVSVTNMSLVLATETNCDMFNEERFETTYKQMLFPLFDNIKELFTLSNIISTNEIYRVIKFPNYSGNDNATQQKSVDIWDALKITFDCSINDWCYNG